MRIREPVVAGRFYPADAETCKSELTELWVQTRATQRSSCAWVGGIVPHAGWVFSGAVTAKVFAALESAKKPKTIVLFGGVHQKIGSDAAMFTDGRWETPLGAVEIDGRLAERILGQTNLVVDDPYGHENEHSIEVQIPFVQLAFPESKIVPIMVPSGPRALEVGEAVGRTIRTYHYEALVIGTTDLTHYGPQYGFTPKGIGAEGTAWAKESNDRRSIDEVSHIHGDKAVDEAARNRNACSGGAVAATIATAKALGARQGTVLEHTSSAEVVAREEGGEALDSVGYVGIVFS